MRARIRLAFVAFGFIVHSLIAIVVHRHTSTDLSFVKGQHDKIDFALSLAYYTAVDATLAVCQLSRSGVRIWHWKINTVIVVGALIFCFSTNPAVHTTAFAAVLAFAYQRLAGAEKLVRRVGLSKYMKDATPDYHDTSLRSNYKYVLLTATEAVLIYRHCVFFLSPIIFVIVDALWNRFTAKPRTKLSDLYVSIFTASMDTGLWMSLFNIDSQQNLLVDTGALVFYLLLVRGLVAINRNTLLNDCWKILNNKSRHIFLLLWLLTSFAAGKHKHAFAAYSFNIAANMLFVYMSCDILLEPGQRAGSHTAAAA